MEDSSVDPNLDPQARTLKSAWSAYQTGQYADAARLYSQVLESNPDQPQALVFLDIIRRGTMVQPAGSCVSRDNRLASLVLYNMAKACHDRDDDEAAVELFQQSLALDPRLTAAFNDLGVSLNRIGRVDAAIDAFDQALTIAPDNSVVHNNRAVTLAEGGHVEPAMTAFHQAMRLDPGSTEIRMQYGLACLKFEMFDQSENAFRDVLALDGNHEDAHINLVQALDRGHHLRAAERACAAWARRQGVVVRQCLGRSEAHILIIAGASPCNTPVKFLFDADRFDTTTVYLLADEPEAARDDLFAKAPAIDVVFNAIGDPDRGARFLEQAAALVRSVGRPVLNAPDQILRTRRDLVPALLASLPGLVMPSTVRMAHNDLKRLSVAPQATARLVRPVGLHNGHDLKLISNEADLAAYLAHVPVDEYEYYVTEYCDYMSSDGYYRKYRFIFIDGDIFPYHLAISKDWLVHYWRANMNLTEWMKREEEMFLTDFRTTFSDMQAETIREVAKRLKLDYAGLDCAISADGRVLFFEANANMLVHLNESYQDFPYKHKYVPRIYDAMARLVARRSTG